MQVLDIKTRIKTLKSSLELSAIQIKLLTVKIDVAHFQTKIAEQLMIIEKAEQEMQRLELERREAPDKIKIIERNMRYNQKELAKLENARQIERLLRAVAELEALKEVTDVIS